MSQIPEIWNEKVKITPALAREWLGLNTRNRAVYKSHLRSLEAMFGRGEFKTTHQGIAFDESGKLLDGQHRLLAIAQQPDGFACEMFVFHNVPRDTFDVIDFGGKRRTMQDVLAMPAEITEVAIALAGVYYSGASNKRSAAMTRPFAEYVSADVLALADFSKHRRVRVWSTATVRAAAVITMKMRPESRLYVMSVYLSLVAADFDLMPPVAQALYRSVVAGKVSTSQKWDLFARCLRVFDESAGNNSRVQIKDITSAMAAARDFIARDLFGITPAKKKATASRQVADGSAVDSDSIHRAAA